MGKPNKHKTTVEEEKEGMEEGDIEENVYSEAGREKLVEDDDEITSIDEGFMKGYDEGSKMAKCPLCHTVLEDDFVEREINGEMYRFCSDKHADLYMQKHSGFKEELDVGDAEEDEEEDSDLEDIRKDKKFLKKSK